MSIRFIPAHGYVAPCKIDVDRDREATGSDRKRRRPFGGISPWFVWSLVVSLAVGLVMPAVSESVAHSRRDACTRNLKQIGLALHNYHSVYGAFPAAAITDPSGRPLLSWRVLILPYMEQSPIGERSLYDEFHLDEPWDSPHNLALLDRMPPIFSCPADHSRWGRTRYLGIHGPHAMFEGGEGVPVSSVRDGTSNTILLAEAEHAVAWTKPEDHQYAPKTSGEAESSGLPEFGSPHRSGFQGLFGDSSVRFIKHSIEPRTLHALLTRDGNEAISCDCY